MDKKRIPWVAGLLSLIAPGLGQLYSGKIYRIVFYIIIVQFGIYSLLHLAYIESIKPFNVILPILIILCSYPYSIIEAFLLARKTESYELQFYNKWYFYIIYPFLLIIILTYTNFYSEKFEGFKVPSSAMSDTILIGDYFWGDKKAYIDSSPKRGDIIIFYPPHIEVKYLKRCIALPGDTLEIINKVVYINGIQQIEPETVKFTRTKIQPRRNGKDSFDNFGPFIVPDNYYFMMGDNRDNSSDSRDWGVVPLESIVGKVSTIYWSDDWNRIGMIPK